MYLPNKPATAITTPNFLEISACVIFSQPAFAPQAALAPRKANSGPHHIMAPAKYKTEKHNDNF